MKITRAKFIFSSLILTAGPGLIAFFLQHCYADGANDAADIKDGGDCLKNGAKESISENHGHKLTVSVSDMENAVSKTYSIQGSSGHDHNVTLTEADFTSLKANKGIQKESTTTDGHSHTVTVNCA